MDLTQEPAEHLIQHKALIDIFEQMIALVNQLAVGEYHSLDLYLNNCRHFSQRSQEAQKILAEPSFEHYLMRNDIVLFYSINSVNMAFGMMTNLLENMNKLVANDQVQ